MTIREIYDAAVERAAGAAAARDGDDEQIAEVGKRMLAASGRGRSAAPGFASSPPVAEVRSASAQSQD